MRYACKTYGLNGAESVPIITYEVGFFYLHFNYTQPSWLNLQRDDIIEVMENQNDLSGGDKNNQSNVPPPPPPRITIRTLGSDIKSIVEGGGSGPVGEVVNVPAPMKPRMPEKTPDDVKINVPGYAGPEERIFTPETLPTALGSAPAVQIVKEGKSKARLVITIAIIAIIAVGFGLGGYFFVYKRFFQQEAPPVVNLPQATTTAETPNPAVIHESFIQADKTQTATNISQITPEAVASGTLSVLKEAILNDEQGNPALFPKYLSGIITEFNESDLNYFEPDFTAFIYYDKDGAWPGYVARIKDDAPLVVVQPIISRIEGFRTAENPENSNLGKLFLENPGVPNVDGFKNGQVDGIPTRYLTFEKTGASLNYGWVGRYLVITTSYPAMQTVNRRLSGE